MRRAPFLRTTPECAGRPDTYAVPRLQLSQTRTGKEWGADPAGRAADSLALRLLADVAARELGQESSLGVGCPLVALHVPRDAVTAPVIDSYPGTCTGAIAPGQGAGARESYYLVRVPVLYITHESALLYLRSP